MFLLCWFFGLARSRISQQVTVSISIISALPFVCAFVAARRRLRDLPPLLGAAGQRSCGDGADSFPHTHNFQKDRADVCTRAMIMEGRRERRSHAARGQTHNSKCHSHITKASRILFLKE